MELDAGYTSDDHVFRDEDEYALAKYRWTLRALKRVGYQPPSEIMNIGCGAGTFNRMAADFGFRVKAFEPDHQAFQMARESAPVGVDVFNLGLFDIDTEDKSEVIVIHDVLEHIEDESRAVEQLSRLIKPGGCLIVTVPANQFLFGLHDEKLGHYRRYRRRSLKRALSPFFTTKRSRYLGFTAIPLVLWYSRIRRKPYPTASASGGLVTRVFKAVCKVEERVSSPIGTSLLLVAIRR